MKKFFLIAPLFLLCLASKCESEEELLKREAHEHFVKDWGVRKTPQTMKTFPNFNKEKAASK